MALRGNNFFYQAKAGTSIPAQSVANATVNGNEVKEPWRDGRQLVFIMNFGAFAASASGILKVQGLRRDDGTTWEDIQKADASGDLEVLQTKLDDAGAAENATLVGTLDLADVDGVTYKSLRAVFIAEHATATQLVSVSHFVFDLYERPSAQADEFFAALRPVDTP